MLFTLFKFLHIATMFLAVCAMLGMELLLHRVAHTRDVRAIRAVFVQARSLELIGPVLFLLGIVFGLITARLGSFNFFAPWLLIAYTLIVLIGVNGRVNLGGWVEKLLAAAEASSVDAPSSDLQTQIADKRAWYAFVADIVLIVLVVFAMVAKPGGIQ